MASKNILQLLFSMDLSLFRGEITVVFSLQFTLEKKSFEPMSPNVAVLHVIKPFRFTIFLLVWFYLTSD